MLLWKIVFLFPTEILRADAVSLCVILTEPLSPIMEFFCPANCVIFDSKPSGDTCHQETIIGQLQFAVYTSGYSEVSSSGTKLNSLGKHLCDIHLSGRQILVVPNLDGENIESNCTKGHILTIIPH